MLPTRLEGEVALHDGASRDILVGAGVATLFFGAFLGWSMFARLDAAAYAQGSISVEGHRQTVQHRDGGLVSGLYVKEGDRVKAGQVLISLAPVEIQAEETSMASQVIGLEAQRARLMAELRGDSTITPPKEFATLTGFDSAEAKDALRLQSNEMQARRQALAGQKSVLKERQAQLDKAIEGYQAQVVTNDRQASLIGDELKGTQDLAAKGFASQNRVRALQRDDAGLAGTRADLMASTARSRAQITETAMQALSLNTDRAQEDAKDLRDVESQLNDVLPKLEALKIQLANLQIRAPVSGQVVGLSVFTVGGVISAGQKLMDIVPSAAPLVIDAQVPAASMDGLYVGQSTEIRIASMQDRKLPILNGRITKLSADSLADEKTGARYFTMEVTVPIGEAALLKELRGSAGTLRAGLPVQVMVPLRKRTAFQYLTEPLTQAMWTAGRER
ncbi:HlyD family type I secretion periplasmic adaptor subunit [Caulobacter sp. S45]|uniref:HlyD family type I secretion periplasmic adaptor subunit n=1 Tax=Caulobacter sp. S45 TaxID=1641861 RepID=UPI0020C6FCDA|nr:HlyD family type I secretion periplasmic adaptor subunit [Caulobacter sp. S45]